MISLRRAGVDDFAALALFIENHNQNPETHCIQSSSGEGADSLAEELRTLRAADELVYVVAEADGHLVGALGCEYSLIDGRGWLRGPVIAAPGEDGPEGFPAVAKELLRAVLQALPPSIVVLDAFLNAANQRGLAFYASKDFRVRLHCHVYVAMRPERPRVPRRPCDPMSADQLPAVQALHSAVFAGLRSAEDTFAELDDDHRVWVYATGGDVAGYVLAIVEPWSKEGTIEFLGVRADARGQGIGGALLETALRWCFAERDVVQVGLTVDDSNTNARSLYEAAGFRLKYSGTNQRWEKGTSE